MQLRAEAIFNVIKHVKPYEECSLRNHESDDKLIRFYDEREWRYVPDLKTFESYLEKLDILFGLMDNSIFNNHEILNQANSILESAKLSFKPDDIKYIIVKEEKEILEMIRKLDQIKGEKYPSNIIKILTSRILTYDQIENDF
jgi:hypothetical protein